jgi:mannose-6-phosphate isomerase-like protein (cupin superfamily)
LKNSSAVASAGASDRDFVRPLKRAFLATRFGPIIAFRYRPVAGRPTPRHSPCYHSIDHGGRYQVKRIVVTPGQRLPPQRHHHRAEHWFVVKGTAEVTCGDAVKIVHENESIYLPIGVIHEHANPGTINQELIEVQTGSYLGEDDIIRLEEVYNRVE